MALKCLQAHGSAESLIPIYYANLGSAQEAADHVQAVFHASVKSFDTVSHRLLQRWESDVNISKALQAYIESCRFYCTGNLSWR